VGTRKTVKKNLLSHALPNKALQLTARQHVSQVNFFPSARVLIARRS
jgi:hypothetical protein